MKHCLIGAAWVFIALGLTTKLAAILMFVLLFTSLGIWWSKNWDRQFELDK